VGAPNCFVEDKVEEPNNVEEVFNMFALFEFGFNTLVEFDFNCFVFSSAEVSQLGGDCCNALSSSPRV